MSELDFGPRSTIDPAEITDELWRELTDIQRAPVGESQYIGYVLLNRHAIGEQSPIVAPGGSFSDVSTASRAYEGAHLAAGGRPVLMLDMFGHGRSSPHTWDQVKKLCFERDIAAQAEPITEAIDQILPDDALDFFGLSHGAFLSLKSAALLGAGRVNTVFGADLPATKKQPTLKLQYGYIIKDNWIGAKRYNESLEGGGHEQDFEAFKDLFQSRTNHHLKPFPRNDPRGAALNLLSSVNATTGAFDVWQDVMETTEAEVYMRVAEHSSVSNAANILSFVGNLPLEQRERSHVIVVPDEDHNMNNVKLMKRVTDWAHEAFEAA